MILHIPYDTNIPSRAPKSMYFSVWRHYIPNCWLELVSEACLSLPFCRATYLTIHPCDIHCDIPLQHPWDIPWDYPLLSTNSNILHKRSYLDRHIS